MQNAVNRRGNVLLIVFSVMFVLITLVGALHMQQAMSRAVYMHEDAILQARLANEYALAANVTLANGVAPAFTSPDLGIKAQLNQSADQVLAPNLAAQIFDPAALKSLAAGAPLSFDDKLKGQPGLFWNQLTPKTQDPALNVDQAMGGRGHHRYLAVFTNDFPYAAYAPAGSVNITQGLSQWGNPVFEFAGAKPEDKHAGAASLVAAGQDIKVSECRYGTFYSEKGTIAPMTDPASAVVGLRGRPPNLSLGGESYEARLETQINGAISAMSGSCQDKTDVFTAPPIELSQVLGWLTGSGNPLTQLLSLRQAKEFPFFMIPGIDFTSPPPTPGLNAKLIFHVPDPPDFGGGGGSDSFGTNLVNLQADTQAAQAKADASGATWRSRQDEYEADPDDDDKHNAATSARNIYDNDLADYKDKSNNVKNAGQGASATVTSGVAAGIPATRQAEKDITDSKFQDGKGQEGFSYKALGSLVLSLINPVDAIAMLIPPSDFPNKLANKMVRNHPVAHFGRPETPWPFDINGSTVKMKATFNVPTGRSVKIAKDVEITGDLWLQRGSTLVVDGNLRVLSDGTPSNDLMQAGMGRVFLEEGSTLVVTRDFQCTGSQWAGSVLVGAPFSKTHPCTTAILCQGKVNIPWGVFPAFTLADVESTVPVLTKLYDVVFTILPNLSKVVGPFHGRLPFFSRYASQIWIITVWIYIPPAVTFPLVLPVPVPVPTTENINNTIFRIVSLIYQTELNVALGDNFLTHTDWWFLGNGRVPLFPKVNPQGVLDTLNSLALPTLPDLNSVTDSLTSFVKDTLTNEITKLVSEVIVKLIASQIKFNGIGVGDMLPLDQFMTALTGAVGLTGTGGPPASSWSLGALQAKIESALQTLGAQALLAECPGVFIYSGSEMTIGGDGLSTHAPVVAGYLVAKNRLTSHARFTIGSLVSLTGDVQADGVLNVPGMTRLSLYKPRNTPTATPTSTPWLDWGLEYRYGKDIASGQTVEIGPKLMRSTMEGWRVP